MNSLKAISLKKMLEFLAILLIILGLFGFIKDMILLIQLKQTQAALSDINVVLNKTQTIESSILNVNEEFYAINKDYVGWISIEDTSMSYPIVLGEDNSYYLTHDFYQKDYAYGAIFMDYRNHADFSDAHLAIYGHAARYQALFGFLNDYQKESFYQAHPIIEIQTLDSVQKYQIFSVYVVDASVTTLDIPASIDSIQNLIQFYKSQSLYAIDVDVSQAVQVLSLVSCNYDLEDGRIIVQAIPIQ